MPISPSVAAGAAIGAAKDAGADTLGQAQAGLIAARMAARDNAAASTETSSPDRQTPGRHDGVSKVRRTPQARPKEPLGERLARWLHLRRDPAED